MRCGLFLSGLLALAVVGCNGGTDTAATVPADTTPAEGSASESADADAGEVRVVTLTLPGMT